MPALPLLLLLAPLAQDGFPPVRLPSSEGMDPEVVSHIEQHVKLVEAAPADGEAHAELGLAYEANTCFELAVQCYRHTVALMPDKPEWVYRLGVMLVATGELEEAREKLETAAAALKNTMVIQARLGAVRLELGDIEGAQEAWLAAIAAEAKQQNTNQVWPQSRVGLAQVRYEQERYQDAATLLEEAIRIHPQYRHAHYLLSLCLFELGEDERAEIELGRGLNAWPEYPPDPHQPRLSAHAKGYHHRMMTIENLLMSGLVQEAGAMVQEVLATRPEDPFALNLLAKCLQAVGQLDQSIEVLLKSEAVDPERVATRIQLAVAFLNKTSGTEDPEQRQSLIQEALTRTQAAVQLAPRQGRVHFFHGLALLASGDGQNAFNEMNAGMRIGCDEPMLYQHLTQLSASMGRLRDMVEFAERNVTLRPEDPNAHQLLVQAYMTDNRLDEGERALERIKAFQLPQLDEFIRNVEAFIAQKRAEQQTPPGDDDGN